MPETGRLQATNQTNLETQEQTEWIEMHQSQVNMCFLKGPLRWLTEQKNPKFLWSLQNAQRDATNLAIRTKLRHRQSHKLTWAPATSRRSLVEFQMIGDRVRHSLSALWTSQVLHISIYSACSAEEWPVILLYKEAKIKETEFIHLPRRLFPTPC